MRSNRALLSIAMVCLILGVMLSILFHANRQNPSYISSSRWASLTKQIDDLRQQNDVLAEEVLTLREQLSRPGVGSNTPELEKCLAEYSAAAGLTPISGPGIILVLDDGTAPVLDPNYAIVHDAILLRIVNELNSAGARAISINGERIVSTSEIRCAGPIIVINMHRMGAPFEMKVIGDPKKLENTLRASDGELEILRQNGFQIRYKIQQEQRVEVPAFKGVIPAKYAHPVGPHPGGTTN